MSIAELPMPECWGHRGASAAYPENTLASFSRAMADGADGIESDIHVTRDSVLVMFHDPRLDRTTDMTGFIRDKNWHGDLEHARTNAHPIPTFAQTLALLMQDGHKHVKFNIDVKVENDTDRLFQMIMTELRVYPTWETELAPRIVVGLWHPKFIAPAQRYLPSLRLSHIGMSPKMAREYFWDACESFSLSFSCLLTDAGTKFRRECREANKKLMVWTVNRREEMIEVVRWGASVILTDHTALWQSVRNDLMADWNKLAKASRLFLWKRPDYYRVISFISWSIEHSHLVKVGGRFQKALHTHRSHSGSHRMIEEHSRPPSIAAAA